MLDESRREREGKREEERREGRNLVVGRHRVGGGRKAKCITSLLEQSQKGKDMSQWTDCTSLSLALPLLLVLEGSQAPCV